MSNRMSVLSRRLERFAVGFSVATCSFFVLGVFANANNQSQLVFLSAGLASVCFFAAFFLWLAHGFAWAMIPEKTAEARKPAEAMRPAEAMKPAEAAMEPTEAMRPAEAIRPAEAKRPAEEMRPAEATKPAEAMRPAEAKRPAEATKPAEEPVMAEEDPPDAKYTITGKRIY